MNVFKVSDDDGYEGAYRIFGGDSFEDGRILLTSSGRAFVEVSPFIGLGEFRRGNRKLRLPSAFLHAILAIFIGEAADKLAERAAGPASSMEEAGSHFRDARKVERKAADMRIEAGMLFGAPVEVAASAVDFRRWFDEHVVSSLADEWQAEIGKSTRGLQAALSDGWTLSVREKTLKDAIATLAEELLHPPSKADLWKELAVAREDRKSWRDVLKRIGFDWLPSGGKGGRPRKV